METDTNAFNSLTWNPPHPLVPTLLWADLTNRYIQLIVAVTAGMGIIGWVDDYFKAVRKQRKGLVARKKLAGQLLLGLGLGVCLFAWPPAPGCRRPRSKWSRLL